MAVLASYLASTLTFPEACQQTSLRSEDSNQMCHFDLLYMASDTLYGNEYKYIPLGINVASRYKVARPLRTKQAADVATMIADMIANIYKDGPLTYPKIF